MCDFEKMQQKTEQCALVSVIIPSYKRDAKTVNRALNSLLNQTYKNIQLILVDDNAKEELKGYREELKELVEKLASEKIIYIQNEQNLGSAGARNKGVQVATGEYITFLDDDDIYLESKISNQLKFMIENQLDYCVTDIDLYYDDGTFCEKRTREGLDVRNKKSLLVYHLMHKIASNDTMMFKKEYFNQIGGFGSEDVGEDFYLIHRAIEGDGKFGYLPVSDIKAFVHREGDGLSIGESKIKGENSVYAYIKKYFSELTFGQRQYIKMRHYAVLAFAYLRKKQYFKFLISGVQSFFCSPIACVKLILNKTNKKV